MVGVMVWLGGLELALCSREEERVVEEVEDQEWRMMKIWIGQRRFGKTRS
jgi:hypothetical protein